MHSHTSYLTISTIACFSRLLLAALFAACVILFPLRAFAQQKNVEMEMKNNTIKSVGGNWEDCGDTISIGGTIYEGFARVSGRFDIRGWDHFTALIGGSDELNGQSTEVAIAVDNVNVYTKTIHTGRKAILIDIPLTGRNVIDFKLFCEFPNKCVFVSPKLIKGNPVSYFDPDGLKLLIGELCDQLEAVPGLQEKLTKSTIGLASFSTINIPNARGMTAAAAEDMSTACIKRKLSLVERGLIDRALTGMGITDVSNITPEIAKTLAKRTGCQFLIIGTFFDPGGPESIKVVANARILDLVTGKSVVAHRMEIGKIPPGLSIK
ncbi:MAG: NPCBM/NEW2 domain-containing protein [Armatimonadota bacterium]